MMMNSKPESGQTNSAEPPSPTGHSAANATPEAKNGSLKNSFLKKLIKPLLRSRTDQALKEALAEVMAEDVEDRPGEAEAAIHQKLLISNILELHDMTAFDVMVPRADIVGIEINTPMDAIYQLLSKKQYSRLPVYRDTLDDVVGTIHIKDLLAKIATGESFSVPDLVREVPIISPALPVLDLLRFMRQNGRHMVLVVDEYGGIDGLVTINDIVETIVGEIEDEYDSGEQPQMVEKADGTVVADGRVDIETFEQRFGDIFDEEELEDVDTLAGLVFSIAGRVPARGEVLTHESGIEFEILDADPRRINRLRIRNIPGRTSQNAASNAA